MILALSLSLLAVALLPILLIFGLALIALINILKSDFRDSTTKLIWVLVVLFLPFIGPILYFIIAPKDKRNIKSTMQ